MAGWNFADVWEAVAETTPDAAALVQGSRRLAWSEVDRRADGVARHLLDLGVGHQDKVAQYMYNCPEYSESTYASFKAGLVPVNTNYRYAEDELAYLWDNDDAVAVVFHGTFAERAAAVRGRVPRVRSWLWVDDGSGPCPDWATPYEDAAKATTGRVVPPWGRSGDDLWFLYTGGTTGMPKGVMCRQDDVFSLLNAANPAPYPVEPDYDAVRARLRAQAEAGTPQFVGLPAAPLMHGTGAMTSFNFWSVGGAIVTLEGRHFDAVELLDAIQRERVNAVTIVGDAFAKPILRALEENPGRWDLASLVMMISSGVMWSEPVKQGLLRHHPGMVLLDSFGSSEAVGMGQSVSSAAGATRTAKFALGPSARVLADDGREVAPGSGEVGRVAVVGRTPVGYYKDPDKTARTFPVIGGVRHSVPGDYATVEADGTITLLGRGSQVINTGGEKVYPEEVEEVLKEHPSLRDAAVVGVPDERFGEVVTAVVEPAPGASVDEAAVIAHVKGRLAAFKAPKRVLAVETIGRAPNGKVDYRRLKTEAVARVAAPA